MRLVNLNLIFAYQVFGTQIRLDPLVRIDQGLVRGQLASDGDYATFLGIPYASVDHKHPFESALPPPQFDETFNARDGSIKCPQIRNPFDDYEEQNLDCLTLNIYVPNESSSQNLLPVLVWIHGGGFSGRSAGEFHPSNLVKHGIIVVTINYRLGPYGFMCLDIPSVQGNQGIKDQHKALTWVKDNIAAFGGDPNDVTLGGESAGSACVLYHLYSNKEKLYNKIIVQSDTPQNEGMFAKQDVLAAFRIAKRLGFYHNDTKKVIDTMYKVPPTLLLGAVLDLGLTFKPCKEVNFNDTDTMIEKSPLSMYNEKKVKGTPVLIGHTTREHMGVLLNMYGADYLNRDPFYEKLKSNFNFDTDELAYYAKLVRHFYIGDELLDENMIRSPGAKATKNNQFRTLPPSTISYIIRKAI